MTHLNFQGQVFVTNFHEYGCERTVPLLQKQGQSPKTGTDPNNYPIPIFSGIRLQSALFLQRYRICMMLRGEDKEGVIMGRFYAPQFSKSNMFFGNFPGQWQARMPRRVYEDGHPQKSIISVRVLSEQRRLCLPRHKGSVLCGGQLSGGSPRGAVPQKRGAENLFSALCSPPSRFASQTLNEFPASRTVSGDAGFRLFYFQPDTFGNGTEAVGWGKQRAKAEILRRLAPPRG